MKLSEAIRLGSMLDPQGFGTYSTVRNGRTATCALGAASKAMFGDADTFALAHIPILDEYAQCPQCFTIDRVFEISADHLNDTHRWTRERIADWVETIEAKMEQPKEEAVEVEA